VNDIYRELESKALIIREGASLRTADELRECFIADACGLLDVNPQVDAYNEDDRSEALETAVREYETQLGNANYTVVWDDGYVIYKDLSEKALEALENY
jgi:hypothetical protein